MNPNISKHWRIASSIWLVGGFLFPLLNPAAAKLSGSLQSFIVSAAGMSDELGYRVAFTLVRMPLTASLAAVIAAVQCVAFAELQAQARRWIVAAALAAGVATLIFLPTTLVALQLYGDLSRGMVRVFLLVVPGAALLAGLVSVAQKRSVRKRVRLSASFVAMSALAAAAGVFGALLFEQGQSN